MGAITTTNPTTNIAPLNTTGFDSTAHVPWSADSPTTVTVGITATPHNITTPPAFAVVEYYSPVQGRVVTDTVPIGGFGTSYVTVHTGVPIGSPLSVGEVTIGVVPASALPSASGAGLLAKALGRFATGLTGSDSLRESSQFKIILQSITDTPFEYTPLGQNPHCFLAGTAVSMWPLNVLPDAEGTYDQKEVQAKIWTKPIEEITPEDVVVSYDKNGLLVPGRVTRTFENRSKHVLDLPVPNFDSEGSVDGTFGSLMITPGHVTYCAKVDGENNRFADKHVPIIDILRSDGALMLQDGTFVRAATGAIVGTAGDRVLFAHIFEKSECGEIRVRQRKELRTGTRWILDDGQTVTMADVLKATGLELIEHGQFAGYVRRKNSDSPIGFEWVFSDNIPNPEDYVLKRSNVTLEQIVKAQEWEGKMPETLRSEPMTQPDTRL